jgi:hypothetical protein
MALTSDEKNTSHLVRLARFTAQIVPISHRWILVIVCFKIYARFLEDMKAIDSFGQNDLVSTPE